MNAMEPKYKSLFYSLGIHVLFALVLAGIYYKQEKEHKVYSLVELQSINFCSPPVQTAPTKTTLKVRKSQTTKVHKSQTAPTEHKAKQRPLVKKNIPVKKALTKSVEVAELKPVPVPIPQEEAHVMQEVIEEPVRKVEVAEQENTPAVAEVASLEEESSQTAVSAVPKLSYEAQYMDDHIALINALIKKNLSYPRLAQKRGMQGKTMVSFTLNIDGKISDVEALGFIASILKKSAIRTIEKASPFFPHPKETLALRIPIVYKLH